MRHWIGVSLLVILLAAAGIFGLRNEWLLTRAASVQAQPIDQLFSYLWILISVLGALIIGFVLYSIIFFRRKPGDESDAAHIEGNNALEVTWTVLPLVAVVGFAVLGSQGLAEVLRVDPQALEVRVIGQQWSWRFEYPEQGIISDELYLPLNQQVLLRMESSDVLHSFWVPEFRVKQDLLPGTETQLRITPNRLGDFEVVCAEICGQLHTTMVAQVHVVGESEFERWIIEQSDLPEDPVARGAIWVEQFGCLACHTLDGTPLVGPTWQGLAGRQETMTDGTTVTADEAYLRQSILDPQALIVQGFPAGVMPQNYGEVLTDLQLDDIIAYLQTLR